MPTPMVPSKLPFIKSLKAEADSFANCLTILAVVSGVVMAVWMGAHAVGLVDIAVPDPLRRTAIFFCGLWLVFYSLASLIDYTIYAVWRAFNEYITSAVLEFIAGVQAEIASDTTANPTERDPTVAYLHDFLRSKHRPLTDSDPLPPLPPAA